jgi:uncharacterized membrane protein
MKSRLLIATFLLAIFGAVITGYLTLEHGRGESPACLVGHGCAVIASSKYAHISVFPTAALGLFTYLVLAMLAGARLLEPPEDIEKVLRFGSLAISLIAFAFTAWLLYIAEFVLHATCTWCIASAVTITSIFVLNAVDMRRWMRDRQATENDLAADA